MEPEPTSRYFPKTGHYLAHGFLGYWESRDNPAEDGYPISEEFNYGTDSGETVTAQYFERARYEWQPAIANNQYGVVLGRIGAESRQADEQAYSDAFKKQDPPDS